jgi:hypothetical protein
VKANNLLQGCNEENETDIQEIVKLTADEVATKQKARKLEMDRASWKKREEKKRSLVVIDGDEQAKT